MLNTLRTYTDQQRHDYLLKKYILNTQTSNQKRDIDIIREGHRFLWDDDKSAPQSWEERLVRKYYNKLFKEYCIGDLTYYKNNKIGLRWRTESEVISGKGQFQCACVKCEERTELRTWEVNFAYLEKGEKKNTLIKIRLCPQHSTQLNYTTRKREIKRFKRTESHKKKKKNSKVNSKHDNENFKSSKVKYNDVNEENHIVETSTTVENTNLETNSAKKDEENDCGSEIWSKKLEDLDEPSRETEFERFLQDMLF